MKKTKDKLYEHSIEPGINMYLDGFQIIQQLELEDFSKAMKKANYLNPYHIYFILKRPKISYDKSTTIIYDDYIKIGYRILLEDDYISREILIKNPIEKKKGLTIVSKFPYSHIVIKHGSEPIIGIKLSVLVDEHHRQTRHKDNLLDFEVLYIGQAFGKNGKRTALNRLSSHETLQTIYSHAIAHYPTSDIWLMLSCFQQITTVLLSGTVPTKEVDEEKDFERFSKYHGGIQFSEQQRINFTEAALIGVFQPYYNIEYKKTFPNRTHKTYKECYDIDLNAVSIEVNTSDIRRRLFTKHAKPKGINTQFTQDFRNVLSVTN